MLKYGVDQDGILVCIEDTNRGKTHLKCPYCNSELTAKKGCEKQHHFAHIKETCRTVANQEFPTLPLYNNFNIHLSGKDLEQLKFLWTEYGSKSYPISGDLVSPGLIKAGLLQKNIYLYPPAYEFINLGKIPVGALELRLFNELQEPLLLKKLLKLELAVEHAEHKNSLDLSHRFTDLILYRTQLKRILSCALYFLEIQANEETLHKIGVTQRPLLERVTEIERDLLAHYKTVSIKVLGTWLHRGNVELYFKHRYDHFNYPVGNLTEYYKFPSTDFLSVMGDLQQMQPKVLSEIERGIVLGHTPRLVRAN
ncbi:GIY-YIG nuclease family protein [Aetokthonos hydrillicola Thurmond2011]|jgi:hypothetical protein|uniref:GIY-YIG nuclease family protein n=1 Tax=Aetokthonos hydrillicola Thurmond2011 TaxID=2712845 RepID=A0AAP5I8X4_9CYAN|nr:competence protein CoiA family protein [Aetokthonos hydrillicola]MBO3457684.1 GIY-YIG nuclease family protein [Aetokthonos hydrillicola CCALA 1050]MBW4587963.1 GIY-YIG nuclease family protein [Aetokthonos hydrillicola CCALA 1050]MDR9894630.1 GIY-YIG nuclease family protein [Aetokthonos hydrillicola Thurmond2011]